MAINDNGVASVTAHPRGSVGGGGAVSVATPTGVSDVAVNNSEGPSSSASDWREYWDDEVEASYYYNSVTREALWVCPEGFESNVK